jgi:dTMP kinase
MSNVSKLGCFITFEGCDGSGKTTQARRLFGRLQRRGFDALLTREPGGTVVGRRLRHLLKRNTSMSYLAELLLFACDRAMHVEHVLKPALESQRVVLCDRFVDSTIAYQGNGRGLDLDLVHEICRVASFGLEPDLTILLTLPPEDGLKRKGISKDRFENTEISFHRRVQQAYLDLARSQPNRWIVVDGTQTQSAIAKIIWEAASPRLK